MLVCKLLWLSHWSMDSGDKNFLYVYDSTAVFLGDDLFSIGLYWRWHKPNIITFKPRTKITHNKSNFVAFHFFVCRCLNSRIIDSFFLFLRFVSFFSLNSIRFELARMILLCFLSSFAQLFFLLSLWHQCQKLLTQSHKIHKGWMDGYWHFFYTNKTATAATINQSSKKTKFA